MAFANLGMSRDADSQVKTLKQALEIVNKGPPSPLNRGPAHPVARSSPDFLASATFCAIMRHMSKEEAENTYASRVNASMTRAAEETLSDTFQISYNSANAVLKNVSYHFAENVLIKLAHEVALDGMLVKNIERLTRSSTFKDAFAKGSLTLSRFVLPVAKFICKNMHGQDDEKKNEPTPAHFNHLVSKLPSTSSHSSRSLFEDDRRIRSGRQRHETIGAPKEDKTPKTTLWAQNIQSVVFQLKEAPQPSHLVEERVPSFGLRA